MSSSKGKKKTTSTHSPSISVPLRIHLFFPPPPLPSINVPNSVHPCPLHIHPCPAPIRSCPTPHPSISYSTSIHVSMSHLASIHVPSSVFYSPSINLPHVTCLCSSLQPSTLVLQSLVAVYRTFRKLEKKGAKTTSEINEEKLSF